MIALTETGITDADYAATCNGGPYVIINSTAKHLVAADAAWQEPGSEEFLVWAWCYITGVANAYGPIISKWDTAVAGNRSWMLDIVLSAGNLYAQFQVYNVALATTITVTSTRVIPTSAWAFVAGYFQPSTLLRVYSGLALEVALTSTSNAVNVPASLQNGAIPFAVGADYTSGVIDTTNHLAGRVGIFKGVCNVPATNVAAHVARLFRSQQYSYADLT